MPVVFVERARVRAGVVELTKVGQGIKGLLMQRSWGSSKWARSASSQAHSPMRGDAWRTQLVPLPELLLCSSGPS